MKFLQAESMLREGAKLKNSVSDDAIFSIEAVVMEVDDIYQVVPTLMKSDGKDKTPYQLTKKDTDSEWFFVI